MQCSPSVRSQGVATKDLGKRIPEKNFGLMTGNILKIFLPGKPACVWFLEITFMQTLMHVCAFLFVCPQDYK